LVEKNKCPEMSEKNGHLLEMVTNGNYWVTTLNRDDTRRHFLKTNQSMVTLFSKKCIKMY